MTNPLIVCRDLGTFYGWYVTFATGLGMYRMLRWSVLMLRAVHRRRESAVGVVVKS